MHPELPKLVALQKRLFQQYTTHKAEETRLRAVAETPAPAPFDENAATKEVAAAMADDVLNGTTTTQGLKGRIKADREKASSASAKHTDMVGNAKRDATRNEADAAALMIQIREVDMMIRREIDQQARRDIEPLAHRIDAALTELHDALIEYQATQGAIGADIPNAYKATLGHVTSGNLEVNTGSYQPSVLAAQSNRVHIPVADMMAAATRRRTEYIARITGGDWPMINVWSQL